MTKRLIPLCVLLAATACSSGEGEADNATFGASFSTNSNSGNTDLDEGEDTTTDTGTDTGDGDTTTTTTGDGDTTTTTTTGTEETDTGETDTGMEDPCPLICDGMAKSGPNTCAGPYIIGRTSAKNGFFYGGSTNAATDEDNEACGPNDDPSNWDTSKDHFFRIWMYEGDVIQVTQNTNGAWDPRVKVHDEADCVGKAKVCSLNDENFIEYEALKDDWFTIVADGQSIAFQDWGDYTLTVDLIEGPAIDMCSCL